MNATSKANRGSGLRMAVGFTGVLLIAACVSTPAPSANLQAAQQAIAAALR